MRLVNVAHLWKVVGKALFAPCCRQRGHILAEKWAKRVDVYVAHKQHLKARGIGKAFAIELHNALIVHLVEAFEGHWGGAFVAAIGNERERVVVFYLRIGVSVPQHGPPAVDAGGKSGGVCSRSGEVKISQLEHRG